MADPYLYSCGRVEGYLIMRGNDVAGQNSGQVVTQGPWNSRDGFIAETAVRIDKALDKIERLEHENGVVQRHISELIDSAESVGRLQSFAETLRNAREYKIDTLERTVADLKGRIEKIEGPKETLLELRYSSLDSVDARLQDLVTVEDKLARIERLATWAAVMFIASAGMFTGTVVWPYLV